MSVVGGANRFCCGELAGGELCGAGIEKLEMTAESGPGETGTGERSGSGVMMGGAGLTAVVGGWPDCERSVVKTE